MLEDPTRGRPVLPLTEQIYAALKNEILDGLWVGRETFPGEDEVAKRFGRQRHNLAAGAREIDR
ncbi:DNA-binding GntR family transcriptional regulator [Bradyrhizobium sp. LM2.7]